MLRPARPTLHPRGVYTSVDAGVDRGYRERPCLLAEDLRARGQVFVDLTDDQTMDDAWWYWLIDKFRLPIRLGASTWTPRSGWMIERGLVRITTMDALEVGYSARTAGPTRDRCSAPR